MTLPIRERLKNGESVIGSWINSGSPIVAELMSCTGFDFLCVDVEHSAVDLEKTQQLFQAIRSGNRECECFVRLHGIDYAFVKRYLDAGARGVIAPLVRTADEAKLIVEAVKYPPLGNRGVGFCRANEYGLKLTEEFEQANRLNLVAIQVEHIDSVNNLKSILDVEGIDAVFIGPYDLTASMGITGQFENIEYLKVKDQILKECNSRGIACGVHVVKPVPEDVVASVKDGYQLVAYSLDITFLLTQCQEGLATIRKSLN